MVCLSCLALPVITQPTHSTTRTNATRYNRVKQVIPFALHITTCALSMDLYNLPIEACVGDPHANISVNESLFGLSEGDTSQLDQTFSFT